MGFTEQDIQEAVKAGLSSISEYAVIADTLGRILAQKEVMEPFISLAKAAGGTVAPLFEAMGTWSLENRITYIKRLQAEFNVTPLVAAQMLALTGESAATKALISSASNIKLKK